MKPDSLTLVQKWAKESDQSWRLADSVFNKIIDRKKLKVGVEVGVAYGGHIDSIFKNTHVKKITGVDPYRHQRGNDDPMNVSQISFEKIYQFLRRRFAKESRYQHLRMLSRLAAKKFKDGSLDFVYIDGNHEKKAVLTDLMAWFYKVRDRGILAGHDYNHPNFHGVKSVVDYFFRRFGFQVKQEKTVWWVQKKAINISYIIPAYNAEKTLMPAVKSIFTRNFILGDEVIIVNDGSTDNTGKVIKLLQKKYPLSVFNHTANFGGGKTRNTAVEHTKNKLIFCLDADNILALGSIKKLKKYLIETDADAVGFEKWLYFKDNHFKPSHHWRLPVKKYTLEDYALSYKVPGSSGNYLFTKESWQKAGGYPEFAGPLDTWGFGAKQIATGATVTVCPKTYYYHRYGHNSYWVRDKGKRRKLINVLKIFWPYLGKISWRSRIALFTQKR